jgi:hypothetical protein
MCINNIYNFCNKDFSVKANSLSKTRIFLLKIALITES